MLPLMSLQQMRECISQACICYISQQTTASEGLNIPNPKQLCESFIIQIFVCFVGYDWLPYTHDNQFSSYNRKMRHRLAIQISMNVSHVDQRNTFTQLGGNWSIFSLGQISGMRGICSFRFDLCTLQSTIQK